MATHSGKLKPISTITGQRGTTLAPSPRRSPVRARCWIAAMEASAAASVRAISGCINAGSSPETNSGS